MGKAINSEPLGTFYRGGKTKKRREWRGWKDTWYDYTRWLKNWGVMIGFMAKPANLKGFFRYRWMMNYLSVPDFVDRHTEGLRGAQLRIAHLEFDFIVEHVCETIGNLFRADPLCGNDKAFNKTVVVFDENMMSQIMNGFPNLHMVCREIPIIYTPSTVTQEGVIHYIPVRVLYTIEDGAGAIRVDLLPGQRADGMQHRDSLPALVGNQQQVRDLFHHAAVDLLNSRFAVDHDRVKLIRQRGDHFLEIGVYTAITTGCLRPPYGEKSEIRFLRHRLKQVEPCFVEQIHSLPRFSGDGLGNDFLADIVQCFHNGDAKRDGKPDCGVRIYRENAPIGMCSSQYANDCGGDGRFANAAFSGNSDDLWGHAVKIPFEFAFAAAESCAGQRCNLPCAFLISCGRR